MTTLASNLRLLEKKVRQVADLVDDLKDHDAAPPKKPRTETPAAASPYGDLPLLRELATHGIAPVPTAINKEELLRRLQNLMEEIEKVLD